MTDRNSELVQLHKELVALADALSRKQEEATTVEQVKTIGLEIIEVNHRATLVGQLLFKEKTQALSDALKKITEGKADLDKALASIDKLNAFVTGVSKFLALVDKVVDTAKRF